MMDAQILATLDESAWWAAAGGHGLWGWYGIGAALGLGLPLGWGLIRLHRRQVPGLRRCLTGGGEEGTATIEFALVFPILLVLILLLCQVTLLMVGNLFVHYAASAATRAAIVQIPRETTDEARNMIAPHLGSSKFRAIKRAANAAVMPVCGRADVSNDGYGVDPVAYADALRQHFADGAGGQPAWVDTLAEEKMRYANNETDIELLVYDETLPGLFQAQSETYEYGPRDPVTVRVTHRLNLAVPYVRLFFADGEHTTVTGPGGYAIVEAQTTLTNQGIDTSLSDAPDRRRVP
jgi:hypothetical protein